LRVNCWREYLAVLIRCSRSQWPRGLRRRSAAARLLRLWFRVPPGLWMSVCNDSWVLSGRGLCDELITRPEESYWLWCVVVYDLETLIMRRSWPIDGCRTSNKQTNKYEIMCWKKFYNEMPHNLFLISINRIKISRSRWEELVEWMVTILN